MTRWDHKKVYDVLVSRGERQKDSDKNKYVVLYTQDTNCAVLYSSKSNCASEPVHLNPLGIKRSQSWKMEVYQAIRPHISPVHRDSKVDPEQDFIRYSVNDWNKFATALGLQSRT